MSIRGSANFATMAPSKFALRALSQVSTHHLASIQWCQNKREEVAKHAFKQSLAREFGPKGVHVAHVIIDGMIDTERVKGMVGETKEEGTVSRFPIRGCECID